MATVTKAPTANEMSSAYFEQHPREREALHNQEQAGARVNTMKAANEGLLAARARGSHADLLHALELAPKEGELERAEVELALAKQRAELVRSEVREEREAAFRAYARPEIERLIADWKRLLQRNAEFEKVCSARNDALSGSVLYVDNPSYPRLRMMLDAYRTTMQNEYGVAE